MRRNQKSKQFKRSQEFESGTSLVAEYARKGKVMYAA